MARQGTTDARVIMSGADRAGLDGQYAVEAENFAMNGWSFAKIIHYNSSCAWMVAGVPIESDNPTRADRETACRRQLFWPHCTQPPRPARMSADASWWASRSGSMRGRRAFRRARWSFALPGRLGWTRKPRARATSSEPTAARQPTCCT